MFIDEAGSHIAMTREYARAPRGERAHGSVPRNAGTITTMIGALDVSGVRAMMTVEGARRTLRCSRPSKLKALLREFGARTRDALDAAIGRAMDLIARHDATGWFRHCGYQLG